MAFIFLKLEFLDSKAVHMFDENRKRAVVNTGARAGLNGKGAVVLNEKKHELIPAPTYAPEAGQVPSERTVSTTILFAIFMSRSRLPCGRNLDFVFLRNAGQTWRTREDLNLRLLPPQGSALSGLSYGYAVGWMCVRTLIAFINQDKNTLGLACLVGGRILTSQSRKNHRAQGQYLNPCTSTPCR